MKLRNERYANQIIVTAQGEVKFDEKGTAIEPKEALELLAELDGFELESQESKEEAKEPEKGTEESPKRSKKKAKSEE